MTRQQRRAMERKANKLRHPYQSLASRKDNSKPLDDAYKLTLVNRDRRKR